MPNQPVHVDDALSSSLRVFTTVRFRGNYVEWERLPEEVRRPMLQISRELKKKFDFKRGISKEPSSCILPWSNAAFIYGGTEQKKIIGEAHEIKGHHEFNNMPMNKIDCIIVLRTPLMLRENPNFTSKFLLDAFTGNEFAASVQELYATELIERGLIEEWLKSRDKPFYDVASERLKAIESTRRYESITDIPEQNWTLYRYVVARQLRETFNQAKMDPEKFFEKLARVKSSAVKSSISIAKILQLVGEGLSIEEAVKQSVLSKDMLEDAYKTKGALFGRKYVERYIDILTHELEKVISVNNSDEAFEQQCSELSHKASNVMEKLLLTPPFNRVFTESLIVVKEEDRDVSIDLRCQGLLIIMVTGLIT